MDLNELRKAFEHDMKSVKDVKNLERLRVKYLGRKKGKLTGVLKSLKSMPIEKKREIGLHANALRREVESAFEEALKQFQKINRHHQIDLTRPGEKIRRGHLHPLTLVQNEVNKIFRSLNFSVVEGPEVETEYYNFDALNIPKDHPARDMWDTFWLKDNQKEQLEINKKQLARGQKPSVKGQKLLLRTHTSPMQMRYMERHSPPFQIIVPGRVFRYEATDATHEINFGQIEGLMAGNDITIANFKYIIETFLKKFFGTEMEFRYRPSYFPFTEPSWEVDMKYKGKWLEIMGAGMVHPNVFEKAGYNPNAWQGFAFGAGLDRLAMLKYNIPDIRLFYKSDLRFIEQFQVD